jgi:hypothetical protein
MRYLYISLCFVFSSINSYAQTQLNRRVELPVAVSAAQQQKLLNAIDTLLLHISLGRLAPTEVSPVGAALSLSSFHDLQGIEANEKDPHYYKPQLINLYQVNGNRCVISVAYVSSATSQLRAVLNFIATNDSRKVTFSIPLYYLTEKWKTAKVGNVTYHYADEINLQRAKVFDAKNTRIAQKLGLQPEKLDFYLCNNYQEILHLLGYEYDSKHVGEVSDGYGVDATTIFSVMHNEDFSHDAFHYYAAKVRKNFRNSAAEEGVAYSWGNAYYTDDNGEMISPKQLVPVLKTYLKEHQQVSLFLLFTQNPAIFPFLTKVRSLISSVICDEVERRGGVPAIKELIDCGKGDENYFKVVRKFTGIDTWNFDERVLALINNFK